ncbi:MAG: HAMP domain-containing histidine kinase [Nitrosarchaeum sp.]|nr:HAMP domain-containing histidine kinase [Nitrosarchaeum sp.]
MGYFLAVKKINPESCPDLESVRQNADEFGIKVYQLAFNRELHKMYCLCQSPSENEIKEHLKKLQITCDEIVEIENQNASNFEALSNITKIGQTIANFSHEIRQSISIASINSHLIQKKLDAKEFERVKTNVTRIENAIEKMTRQINEVLDFVRIAPLLKKESSIKKILQDSLIGFTIPQNVFIKIPDNDSIVMCDGEKIQSVFSNIIGNAISIHAKRITVTLNEESHFVEINFSDDGPGIPKENIEKIFEPLFTTKPTGTGLGLSICKSIIEQHNGTIKVRNHPTTFTIVLPKR